MVSPTYETARAEIAGMLGRTLRGRAGPDGRLSGVTWLSFHGMGRVRTLEPLVRFPWLEHLDFWSCAAIPDLSVLAGMPNLVSLGIHKGRVAAGGDALQRLPALTDLVLCAPLPPGMEDLPPQVIRLGIVDRQLTAPPPWPGFARLAELRLDETRLASFADLPEMPGLRQLSVRKVRTLASCAGLGRAPALEVLDVNFTAIADLAGIEDAPGLQELRLSRCPVADLSPAFACRGLRTLYCERTKIRSVEGIADAWPHLRHLWMGGTRVRDLEPLRRLNELRELNLSQMKPKSWDFLAELPSLEVLDLSDSTFADVRFVARLPALRLLRLVGPTFHLTDARLVALDAELFARGGGLSLSARPHWKGQIQKRHAAAVRAPTSA